MKIKTKLTLWVGILFILIITLIALGVMQVNELASDSNNILKNNYRTLEYATSMLKALDELASDTHALSVINVNLDKQKGNITEPGEVDITESLEYHVLRLEKDSANLAVLPKIRGDLIELMQLNMQAIQQKSQIAQRTARSATLWIGITGILCFLIAFALLVRLPGSIGNPIRELTESIRQIADKNYSQRVNLEHHNEFGELAKSFNVMAAKLEEYNNSKLAKLMIEKKRIETLINNMHDPVIGLDEKKKIIFVNEEALKVLALRRDELIGKASQEVAVTNDLLRSLIQKLNQNGNDKEKSEPLKIYADGKESFFEKEVVHISIGQPNSPGKTLVGYVIILRNITVFKELESARTNFIATVSHEYKTPISSIKLSLRLLENEKIGTLNDEQHNLLESIGDDANRLLKITGELLNITQVESGNIQLNVIPSDPKEILTYAINANRILAEQKNIKFEEVYPSPIPKLLADSEKTTWVLTNLISNAIRYSYENSTVYLEILSDENSVMFSVRDTGQGIAPQYKSKIFDRYFRIPGSKREGTGLGLAISKEFIEAQGGRITVESDLGAGSTFIVSLNKALVDQID